LFPRGYRKSKPRAGSEFDARSEEDARRKQLNEFRSSVLFSALAAEAYVNEFLARFLTGRDLDAVDRMSTVDKYVVGTHLATGETLFSRDTQPAQTIGELFKLRHKLVHPKPGYGPPPPIDGFFRHQESEYMTEYTAPEASRFLTAVAAGATILVKRAFPDGPIDFPATIIYLGQRAIDSYASELKGLPDRTAEEPEDLLAVALRGMAERQIEREASQTRRSR
jgi:hypothetical protein